MKELLAVERHRLAGLALLPTTVGLDEFWTDTLNSFVAVQLSETDLTTLKEQYDKLELLKKTPKPSESLSYVPTTIIMNVLSLAHAKAQPLPDDQVVGWFLNPTQFLSGDPFAKSLKPDIVAYVVPRMIAEEYLASLQSPKTPLSNLNELRPTWAQMISAAELKVSEPGQSQLLNYLEVICCYRPDLVSVVAISSKLAGYQFYSLNAARCLKCSDILPWEDKNTPSLQKFIAAVYQTQRSRYEKINYLPKSLQAWTLEGGSESVRRWVMLPFHTGHYPGRGTWVACAIENTTPTDLSSKVHIVKLYWADAGSKWNEGDLYEDAHGKVKIPGLVRVVDHWKTGKVVSGSRKPGGPITTREQICVILASTGRPLNECKDVNQILRCIFDLLETLRVMCDRDVIHRDISWGNVMANPTHTDTDSVAGPEVHPSDEQSPLYISEILKKEMPGSLSLLTDLDCSAKLQGLQEDAKTGRHSRTGTPMFIAMEISSDNVPWRPFPFNPACITYFREMAPSHRSCSRLEWLWQKVKEQLDHIWKCQNASANASANFTQALKDILSTSKPEQKPPLVHTPRHDAESVFWLLWFLLARANPRNEAPVETGSAEKKDYDNFCSIMLNHTVGARTETRAPLAQMSIEQYRQTLHPRFSHLGDMLYYMGSYFLINPKAWSGYKMDHANYFMEYLLLGEMLRNEGPNNLPLDTTQPRPATDPMASVRRDAVTVESRSSHNYAASLTQYNAVPCSVSSSGSKRKPDTDPQGSLVPKRHCTGPAQLRRSSRRSSNQDHAALAGAPPTGVQPESVPPPGLRRSSRRSSNQDHAALAGAPPTGVQPESVPPPRLRRSSRRSSNQDHAALAGAPQTGVQAESVPPPRLRRSSRRSSNQDHAALAGAPPTGIQPEIAQPERNPFLDRVNQGQFLDLDVEQPERNPLLDRVNQGQFLGPDVEQTNYVASQETPETMNQLEQEALTRWPKLQLPLQAFNAANSIQMSMLCGEKWFTVFTE